MIMGRGEGGLATMEINCSYSTKGIILASVMSLVENSVYTTTVEVTHDTSVNIPLTIATDIKSQR